MSPDLTCRYCVPKLAGYSFCPEANIIAHFSKYLESKKNNLFIGESNLLGLPNENTGDV
jgi:hypothetical protein